MKHLYQWGDYCLIFRGVFLTFLDFLVTSATGFVLLLSVFPSMFTVWQGLIYL